MILTGKEGEQVSLREAAEWTKNFRAHNNDQPVIGRFFGRECLEQLLAVPEAMGIRAYFGRDKDGSLNLVLVAANKEGNDILPDADVDTANARTSGQDPQPPIIELSRPCPPACGDQNPLNS